MSDTEEVAQPQEAGCRTCSLSCLGSWGLSLLLLKMQEYFQGDQTALQLSLSLVSGLLLGHLTMKAWKAESRPYLGCIGAGVPLLVFCLVLLQGYLEYQTMLERNMPGWGKADIASYQYPSLSDFMPTLCLGTMGIGWLLATLKSFLAQDKTSARDSF